MIKNEILIEIQNAKNAHVLWFANAMALSVGTDPGEQSVPKKHTDCTFGKWYYGIGQELSNLDSFKAVESVHYKLHIKYNEIFDEFERLFKEGFFNDISLRASDTQKKFNASIDSLKEISKELLEKLTELEKDLD